MNNTNHIDECLQKLKEVQIALKNLGSSLEAANKEKTAAVATGRKPATKKKKPAKKQATKVELESLLSSSDWPLAIPEQMICDVASEEDKLERAEGILELIIGTNLTDRRFLDFGCGEGHCVIKADKMGAKTSVGYDISITSKKKRGVTITENWDDVKKNGPYDTIMAYDVLDHIEKETPVEALKKIREVLADNGKAYLRMHPWCSRHGGHLYQKLNKAFAHLIITEEELATMGHKLMPNQKVMLPLYTYRNWIVNAGLKKIEENISETQPEAFFSQEKAVLDRLLSLNNTKEIMTFQMKMNFVDYVVIKNG